MKRDQILSEIRLLAKSQGFYGKVLKTFKDMELNEPQKYDEMLNYLEEQDFKSTLDIVFFFECNLLL